MVVDIEKLIVYLANKENKGTQRNLKIHDLIDGLCEQGLCISDGVITTHTPFIKKGHYYLCLETHTHAGCKYIKDCVYFASDVKTLVNGGCEDFGLHRSDLFKEINQRFKAGDWIVVDGNVCEVKGIEYNPLSGRLFYVYYEHDVKFDATYVDSYAHLWTVDDAKEGDVLVYVGNGNSNAIFIKKNGLNTAMICGIMTSGKFTIDGCMNANSICVRPANKEERERLMKRISDEGYILDGTKLIKRSVKKEIDIDSLVKAYRDSLPFDGDFKTYGDALAEAFRQGLVSAVKIIEEQN